MLNYLKHSALLFLYFIVYQFLLGFLMVGAFVKELPDIPPVLIENIVWVMGIIGIVLLTVLSIVLWKVIYPRKTIDYRYESLGFHKIYWPILLYVAFVIFQFLVPIPESTNQQLVVAWISDYPILSFFGVVLFAPILEELIFRGFLATYFFPKMLDGTAVGFYLGITATLFSMIHGPATIPQFLLYFTMGVTLGWLYLIKRDIRYSIALHIANNLLSFILVLLST